MQRRRQAAPPSRPTMADPALKERQRKCLQERKARTSPTKVEWTTLRALGKCRGGGEVFPRRVGRGTRAEPGRRSPALSTPRRTRRVRPQAQEAQAGAVPLQSSNLIQHSIVTRSITSLCGQKTKHAQSVLDGYQNNIIIQQEVRVIF